MIELANVITRDVLQAQLDERLQALEQGKQELTRLGQEMERIKANLVAIDGAAQQVKILIEMCDAPSVVKDADVSEVVEPELTDRVKEILTKPTVVSERKTIPTADEVELTHEPMPEPAGCQECTNGCNCASEQPL